MSRLIDTVRARRFNEFFRIGNDTERNISAAVDDIPGEPPTTCILADNVAEYYFERFRSDDGMIGQHDDFMKDAFNVAPPFQRFWIEYQPRIGALSKLVKRVGVSFYASEIPKHQCTADGLRTHLLSYFNTTKGAYSDKYGLIEDPEEWIKAQRPDFSKIPRWLLTSYTFSEHYSSKDQATGPMLKVVTTVAEDGSLACLPMVLFNLPKSDRYETRGVAHSFAILSRPALMAITFMHAKNVTLTAASEPIAPKLQKKRRETGKLPLMNYKLIDIRPVAKAVSEVAQRERVSELEAVKRLKMRGHFKDYRARGLFGKHKDIYFWHGTDSIKQEDVVRRDYRVKGA